MGKENDIALLHYNIGSIYKTVGSYEKAIENCIAGLKIYERLEDKNGIALIYRVMGSIYKYKGDFEKSLTHYFDGLRINEEIGNIQGQANAFNNIGIVYLQMNDFEKALGYYRNSLALNRVSGNESEASRNIGNIGSAYLKMNQLDSAYYYIIKRIESARRLNDKKGLAITLESLGEYYLKVKDYSNCERYYNEALQLSRRIGTPETTKNILLSLSNLYELTSDTGRAYAYYKSHISVRDSLLNMETLQRIEQMEMQYNYEKEMDLHYLLEQKSKLIRIGIFGMLLFFVMLMILIYNNQNIKLKKKILEQKSLEMDKQQLQYHVHFQNKELVSKAIHLAEQNEFIDAITVQLEEILLNPKGASISLKDVISDLKFHSDITAWKEFEYTFLQVHPDFFTSLAKRFPELTPNERRLSAFLRLNLSTKDISNITHQSLHSLVVARTRLRRKLGITNTGDNLATFLSQF
jgi:tetratricopeptide (TPR) repeat protein